MPRAQHSRTTRCRGRRTAGSDHTGKPAPVLNTGRLTLFGIRNCDQVRRARHWLAGHRLEYRFHDLRADGLPATLLDSWIEELGWEALLNRCGSTWRQLSEEQRARPGPAAVRDLMLARPTLIRRPLLDTGRSRHLGFSDELYTTLFAGDSHGPDPGTRL
jgi:Spx/MgsR family transcriptional regulator